MGWLGKNQDNVIKWDVVQQSLGGGGQKGSTIKSPPVLKLPNTEYKAPTQLRAYGVYKSIFHTSVRHSVICGYKHTDGLVS